MKAARKGPINWVRVVAVTVVACLSFLIVFVGSKQRLSRQASSGEVWRGFDGQRMEEWKGFKESNVSHRSKKKKKKKKKKIQLFSAAFVFHCASETGVDASSSTGSSSCSQSVWEL
jgi:hypothetical protein